MNFIMQLMGQVIFGFTMVGMTSSNLIQSLPDTMGSSIMRVMNQKMKSWWWRKMNQMMMMIDEFDLWASLEEMGMCIARKEGTLARSLRPRYPSFMVILQSSDITHDAVVSCLLLLFFSPN